MLLRVNRRVNVIKTIATQSQYGKFSFAFPELPFTRCLTVKSGHGLPAAQATGYARGMSVRSFRPRLREFQAMRGDPPDPGFISDLEFLENRDLDLSIRLGAMLAFNALLVTIGTHPISASPGAPLSLDAPTQPLLVIASLIGVIPFIISSALCLRALLVGEDFDADGETEVTELRRRIFAAFVHSIDVQGKFIRQAVMQSFVGGGLTILVWAWILIEKMV